MNDNKKNLMLLEEAAEEPTATRFSADGRFCYVGYSFAGTTSVDSPTWKIKRIELAQNGDTYTTFVNGEKDQYSHVFDRCETYTYAFPR